MYPGGNLAWLARPRFSRKCYKPKLAVRYHPPVQGSAQETGGRSEFHANLVGPRYTGKACLEQVKPSPSVTLVMGGLPEHLY